ncbi:MAG: 3-dehydroquinate synthase [Rhodospirillales bacterium]|nr:3-dehydroquinate synthase [Rhodospirillales bacterium]
MTRSRSPDEESPNAETVPGSGGAEQIVEVALGARTYEILVGRGLLAGLGARLAGILTRPRVLLVTEERVAAHHLPAVERALRAAGIAVESLILPAGEATKSFARLEDLCRDLIRRGLERSDLLLALGGGVIGDLVGFAAAILLRGIDFVQVPTTLLAQVDSSVGGKTAIDVPEGKNLVGAFHQPRLVVADSDLLRTLPRREMRAGYAEVVKYGLLGDRAFFDWLQAEGAAVIAGEAAALQQAVARSCQAKAAIVAEDEQEAGKRALLNLGHTFGHALEAAAGYDGRLLHGEAVSIGMRLAFDLSARLGICAAGEARLVREHLDRLGLPTGSGLLAQAALTARQLLAVMQRDKKVAAGRISFVLARAIGDAFVSEAVDPAEVEALLDDWLRAGRLGL